MEKHNPKISKFDFIYQAFLSSENEAALNESWQTVIFTVPNGHQELTPLHQAAKTRQAEIRKVAAEAKAKQKSDEEEAKKRTLIIRDTTKDDNGTLYNKKVRP